MSFVVDLIAMVFGMPRALFPQIAHQSFGGPVEGGTTMALLAAAISAGAVAGGVFSGWLPRIRRQGLVVVGAIVVWGLAMVGFGCSAVSRWGHLPLAGQASCCGPRWRSWRWAGPRTWCRRRSGRRSCSRRHPTMCGDGCRACSPSWSPAVRGWPTRSTVALRPSSAPPSPLLAVARSWLSACSSRRWRCRRSSRYRVVATDQPGDAER